VLQLLPRCQVTAQHCGAYTAWDRRIQLDNGDWPACSVIPLDQNQTGTVRSGPTAAARHEHAALPLQGPPRYECQHSLASRRCSFDLAPAGRR
jgi:hypothetical protein